MSRLSKISLFFLVILIAYLTAIFTVARATLDPNRYATQIKELLYAETNRHIAIRGPITRHILFPWTGLSIKNIVISNPAHMTVQPFATIQEVTVKVKVWPLLWKKLDASAVDIYQASFNLLRLRNGNTNYATSGTLDWNNPLVQKGIDPGVEASPFAILRQVSLDHFALHNSRIRWFDERSHQLVQLYPVALTIAPAEADTLMRMVSTFTLSRNLPIPFTARMQLTGELLADDIQLHLQTVHGTGSLVSYQKKLSQPVPISISSSGIYTVKPAVFRLENTTFSLGALQGKIFLMMQNLFSTSSAPIVKGHIDVLPFNPTILNKMLGVTLDSTQAARCKTNGCQYSF